MRSDVNGFAEFATTKNFDFVGGRNQTVLFENIKIEIGNVLCLGNSIDGVDIDAPLLPRVAVPPLPEPAPRPIRLECLMEPLAGLRLLKFIFRSFLFVVVRFLLR